MPSSVPRKKIPTDQPIPSIFIQPLPTGKYGGDASGRVGDLHPLHQPARGEASVVVLDPDLLQLPHVQRFQVEPVGFASLKEVPELVLQGAAPRVPVEAVDGDEDIGVGARALLEARDHNGLVLDWHQAPGLAGKALRDLGTLEDFVVPPLVPQGDLHVAPEEVPAAGEDVAGGLMAWRNVGKTLFLTQRWGS